MIKNENHKALCWEILKRALSITEACVLQNWEYINYSLEEDVKIYSQNLSARNIIPTV